MASAPSERPISLWGRPAASNVYNQPSCRTVKKILEVIDHHRKVYDTDYVDAADREKSIRFAMSMPELDAVVIGFKNRSEIDEAIRRINSALA